MNKRIYTEQAPKAVGPYAPGVVSGDLLFVSGQTPLDPASGLLVEGGIRPQSRRALQNVAAVIEAAGFRLEDTVKCSCFLMDLGQFAEFNEVYAEFFGRILPARETVQVGRLPRDAMVEVSAICRRG